MYCDRLYGNLGAASAMLFVIFIILVGPGGPGTHNMTPKEIRDKEARRRIDSDSGSSRNFGQPAGSGRPGLEMGPPPELINYTRGLLFVLAFFRRRR